MLPNVDQYLSPQALLAITIVGPLVPPVFEQFKPLIDEKISPSLAEHDLLCKSLVATIDVLGVFLFMWLFRAPLDARTWVWGAVGSLISYFVGQTVYTTMRGPVPVTPTAQYLSTVVRLHEAALRERLPTISFSSGSNSNPTGNVQNT